MKESVEVVPKRLFVSADPSKCVGCSVCEYVCALEKERSFNPLRSWIRVVRLHPLVNVAVACRFCEDAPCVHACPRNALKQSEENGVILIDEEKCDACGWCIQACDYGFVILGLILKESPWASFYEKKGEEGNVFYKIAKFYTINELKSMLENVALQILEVRSTILQPPPKNRSISSSQGRAVTRKPGL